MSFFLYVDMVIQNSHAIIYWHLKILKSDVVYDKVEKDLAKEIETTQACQQLLVSTKEKIDEQIRKNRSARYYLEKVGILKYIWC